MEGEGTVKINNQLKELTEMLKAAGCSYRTLLDGDEIRVIVEALNTPAVGGIEGMSTEFIFSKHGQLVSIGLWGPVTAIAA